MASVTSDGAFEVTTKRKLPCDATAYTTIEPGWCHFPTLLLQSWLAKAHDLLEERGRVSSGDHVIAQLLGRTRREVDGFWPPLEIAQAIEAYASDEVLNGIYYGVVNSRGVHCRSPEQGGVEARDLAVKYQSLERAHSG